MRLFLQLSLLFCLSLSFAYAEEDEEVWAEEDTRASGSIGATEKDMSYYLDSPNAKNMLGVCEAQESSGAFANVRSKTPGSLAECVWLNLSDSDQEDIISKMDNAAIAKMAKDESGNTPDVDVSKQFDSQDDDFLKIANKSPAFKKLQEFMKKKLEKTIYGEDKDKLGAADHMVFYKLYKSQLSKNVIEAMSTYCLDADPANEFLIPKTATALASIRKSNLANLGNASASSNYGLCISSLKDICYKTYNYKSGYTNKKPGKNRSAPTTMTNMAESSTRACVVTKYIKQMKQSIIAVTKITEKLNGLDNNNGIKLAGSKEVEVYTGNDNDKLITMSSKELIEDSGFKDAIDNEEVTGLQECFANGAIIDQTKCNDFLNEDVEQAEMMKNEAEFRSFAKQKKIEDALAADPEKGATSYLTDQGFTQEEIDNLIGSPAGLQDIETKIRERHEKERKAYITKLQDRIDSKTVDDPSTGASNISKLQAIENTLSSKTERYTQLVHFNNIVSGLIDTEDSNGESGKNTNALAIELAGSAYNPGGNTDAKRNIADIKTKLSAQDITTQYNEDNAGTDLEVDKINNLFNYEEK